MERLTPEDTTFLHLENEVSAMHSVSVAIFDGPEPAFDDVRVLLGERVGFVPRFRQRVVEVPFGLERPVWLNSPQFRLDYHLRHSALPDPSGEALTNLVSRVLSQRLDRGKPLWELWIVSGLADGRWAILAKAHHAIIDGVSGIDPLAVVFDEFVVDGLVPPPWEPDDLPTDSALVNKAMVDLLTKPSEQLRLVRRFSRLPNDIVRSAQRFGPGAGTATSGGAESPHRVWSTVPIPFDVVREQRIDSDVSTNDVLLTYVAMGLRALADQGRPWNGREATALVPYAVGPGGVFTNEVASRLARLPLGPADFTQTLRLVADQGGSEVRGRDQRRRVPAAAMTARRGLSASTIAALGVRRVTRDARGKADTVAVNAPGPREALSVMGRPMVSLASAIPLAGGVPVSFSIVSYVDHFTIGVTTDLDSGLDPVAVTDAIAVAALHES